MNFILFNGVLLIASFPAILIFSVGLMACVVPLAPFLKRENPPRVAAFLIMAVAGGFQIYFWALWAAFCVAVTMNFTQKPEVTWNWLYWIFGFLWCTSPIRWFAQKEIQSREDAQEIHHVQSGTLFYSHLAMGAFLLFAFAPNLTEWPFGWFMKLTSLADSMYD